MKNIYKIATLVTLIAITIVSCKNEKPTAPTLKNQLDSLNYAFGLINGSGIKEYYIKGDSADKKIASLFEGIAEGKQGPLLSENAELGNRIATYLKEQNKSGFGIDSSIKIDIKLFEQGLINGMRGSNIQMTSDDAYKYIQTTMQVLQAKKNDKLYGANKLAGEKFLSENAKKAGVVTTNSGLQYEIIKKGSGKTPSDTSKVKVHYHGTLIDGTVFDSSVERKEPAEFKVNQVIKGWSEALQLMPVGSKYKLYIPQQLAYGNNDQEKIKPFSTLIFEVELLSIEK